MTESPTAVTCPATNPGAGGGRELVVVVVVVVVVGAVVVGRLVTRGRPLTRSEDEGPCGLPCR